jgi:hypothetical protein
LFSSGFLTVDSHFEPQGLLDSQATSQEAVDALITVQMRNQEHDNDIADMTSQDVLDQLDYRRQPVVYGKCPHPRINLCPSPPK